MEGVFGQHKGHRNPQSMKRKLIPSVLFSLFCISLSGQSINTNGIYTEASAKQYMQVKQFGEFLDRFNYKTDWKGNRINAEFEKAFPRKEYLRYLFNLSDSRLTNSSDSSYQQLMSRFTNWAVNTNHNIHLYDGTVEARVIVQIKYNGIEQQALLHMKPQAQEDRSGKWVISKADTWCFSGIADSLKTNFLAPNSHETGFINLKKLNRASNPLYYLPATATADTTLWFVSEAQLGHLEILHTVKTIYFISLPTWEFSVEEFTREDNNSGWLISNLKEK